MSGPLHGSIEHQLNAGFGTGSAQSAFVSVYNFLNNNTGTLGLQRIAYHTGSTGTGMLQVRGINYFDAANPAGENAWACFCFSSASNPFYLFVQWTGGTSFGTAPGSPGLIQGAATQNTIGFAFACRADFGNPWNGSSGSNGFDTKGTPVWHPGTSSLCIAPRSNDGVRAGGHGTNKQNTFGFTPGSGGAYRMSMVADYDNFAIFFDTGNDGTYAGVACCTYTPLSGVNPDIQRFAIGGSSDLPWTAVSAYGDVAGTSANQGSIGYPSLSISGTCSFGFDRYGAGFLSNVNAQPNRAFATPRFDEFPLLVGIFETPNQVGATGQTYSFMREAYNIATHDTNADGTRAAFGNGTIAAIKITVPWSSGTVPGSGTTKQGTQF